MRRDYGRGSLVISTMLDEPVAQFGEWFGRAKENIREPNACVLATVGEGGQPSTRVILLKEFSTDGFVFFTNYQSRKSVELLTNSRASMLFFWDALERQVEIQGTVCKIPRQQSEAYFRTRPRDSQINAWVSLQSREVAENELQQRRREYVSKFVNSPVECPQHWGGFIVCPLRMEFWQGGAGRLHDRICYTRAGEGWEKKRLAP